MFILPLGLSNKNFFLKMEKSTFTKTAEKTEEKREKEKEKKKEKKDFVSGFKTIQMKKFFTVKN